MQRLTRQKIEAVTNELLVFCKGCAFENTMPAVLLIIEERMTGISHVHPYLMSASGLKATFDERYISERLNNFIMCHRMLALAAVREDLHYLAVPDIAAYMTCDGAFLRVRSTPYERNVFSSLWSC